MISEEYTLLGEMDGDFRISIHDSHRLARILKPFAETDKPIEVTIRIHRRQRSLAQNRWMHGVCVPTVMGWLKDTQGEKYTHDEVYVFLNTVVLGKKPIVKEVAGEEVIIMTGKRFSQMTTLQFSEAVDEIVRYFADRGLDIPLPKDGTNNLLNDYLRDG